MEKRYQVFISSTQKDLGEERQVVADDLLRRKYIPHMMERWAAHPQSAWPLVRRYIDQCDYYVVILKGRYGSFVDESGVSYTEREYDYATERGIPVLAFVYEDVDSLPAKEVDASPELRQKLKGFRERIEREHVRDTWTNAYDLAFKVSAALDAVSEEQPGIGWIRGNELPDDLLRAVSPIVDPAQRLGIRRISEDGQADRQMNVRIRQAQKIRIISTSGVRLLEIYRRDLVDAVGRGANIKMLVPKRHSQFVSDVTEMESVFTDRGSVDDEIDLIERRLVDIAAEARQRDKPGSVEVGYFTTHLRSTITLCDEDWGWFTLTLPPLRAAETMSMELTEAGDDSLVTSCIRHFDRIWEVIQSRGDSSQLGPT